MLFPVSEKARTLAAYREAGYAVAAILRGCDFDGVIDPGAVPLGQTLREDLLEDVDLVGGTEVREEIRAQLGRIEDVMVVSLAGPMAAQRYDPSWEDDEKPCFWSDTLPVWCGGIYEGTPISDATADIYEKYLGAMAKDAVDEGWQDIEAVAQRLLKDGTLTMEDVLSIKLDRCTRDG